MPINPDAVGSKSEPARRSWTSKDALIYALGVGAGAADPLDELAFTTENTNGVPQRALPTMAVVLGTLGAGMGNIGTFNPAMLVHGEQGITLHQEIPVEGELESVGEVTGIYDKGKGAVVVSESKATLVSTGEPLFTTRMSAFIRGEGGWGGDRGPSGTPNQAPDRDPDHTVTVQTRCVAGKVVLTAVLANGGDSSADVSVSTPYGAKSATIAAGKTVSYAFTTRLASIDAGQVSVAVVDGDTSGTVTAQYAVRTCG